MHSVHVGSSDAKGGSVSYSDRMRQITENIFQLLQSAASNGNTEITITLHPQYNETAITYIVLQFLRDQMKLGVDCRWPGKLLPPGTPPFVNLASDGRTFEFLGLARILI